jgi:hypothetical protein
MILRTLSGRVLSVASVVFVPRSSDAVILRVLTDESAEVPIRTNRLLILDDTTSIPHREITMPTGLRHLQDSPSRNNKYACSVPSTHGPQ